MQIDRPANTRNGQRGISGNAALRLRNKAGKEAGDESGRLPRLGSQRTGESDRVEA